MNNVSENQERLLRVIASRRGNPIEIRVHYEVERVGQCDTFHLFAMEELS